MRPVFIWRFTGSLNVSTINLTIDNPVVDDVYLPYVQNFTPVIYRLEENGNFGSVGSCEVTLARNATTDALLSGNKANTDVAVDLVFYKDAAIPSFPVPADIMPIARFIFEGVTAITQSSFTVRVIADERKLVTLPRTRFADVSVVPDENRKGLIPIILGDFRNANSGSSGNPAWEAKDHNCAPCQLANEIHNSVSVYGGDNRTNVGEWIIGETKVGDGSTHTVAKVYQYDSTQDILIPAEYQDLSPATHATANAFTVSNVTAQVFAPSSRVTKFKMSADRYATRICEIDAPTNLLTDETAGSKYNWKNCCDEDTTNASRVEAGHTPAYNILAIGWLKQGALSSVDLPPTNPTLAWYSFWITNADKTTGGGTRLTVKSALRSNGTLDSGFQIDITTAVTSFPYYVVAGPISSTTVIGNTTFASVGWKWHQVYLQITCTGVTTTSTQFAEIGSIGVEFGCLDDIVKRATNFVTRKGVQIGQTFIPDTAKFYYNFFSAHGGTQGEKILPTRTQYVAGTNHNVFADFIGPTTMTTSPGLGWANAWTATWHNYAILTDILGFSSTQMDDTVFLRTDDFLSVLGGEVGMGIVIQNPTSAVDILRQINFQGNTILFYSGEGKWKIAPRGRFLISGLYGNAPTTQFSDSAQDYIISNLTWEKIESEFNYFKVKYLYDYARTNYYGEYIKDLTGTLPNGRAADDIEAIYIRTLAAATSFLDNYAAFQTKVKRLVKFDTSLAASILELGDYIKVNHPAIPDNTPRYQITAISYSTEKVSIEALEI